MVEALLCFQQISHLRKGLSLVKQHVCIVRDNTKGIVIGSECLLVLALAITEISVFNAIVFPLQFSQVHFFPSQATCRD